MLEPRGDQLVARLDFARREVDAWTDSHGAALLDPPERRELPLPCRGCVESAWCGSVEIVLTPAFAWRRLGLIEADGTPTRRGVIFSFFHHGEGLAVAAALEDESYAIDDLIFDLANLRAGPRFAGDESRFGGRLGALCQRLYERADLPGYLEMGVPPDYGAGASEVVRAIVEHATPRQKLTHRIAAHRRHRARPYRMAQPAPPHRLGADVRVGAVERIEDAGRALYRDDGIAGTARSPPLTAAQQRRER